MAIWLAVVMMANLEIGWIFWGMGALAGLGMRLGAGDADEHIAGTLALVITLMFYAFVKGGILLIATLGDAGIGFFDVFGPLDLLFIFLACGSAYKIGSNSAE